MRRPFGFTAEEAAGVSGAVALEVGGGEGGDGVGAAAGEKASAFLFGVGVGGGVGRGLGREVLGAAGAAEARACGRVCLGRWRKGLFLDGLVFAEEAHGGFGCVSSLRRVKMGRSGSEIKCFQQCL